MIGYPNLPSVARGAARETATSGALRRFKVSERNAVFAAIRGTGDPRSVGDAPVGAERLVSSRSAGYGMARAHFSARPPGTRS